MNKCCKGHKTTFCPNCGSALILEPAASLLKHIEGRIDFIDGTLSQARHDPVTEKGNNQIAKHEKAVKRWREWHAFVLEAEHILHKA